MSGAPSEADIRKEEMARMEESGRRVGLASAGLYDKELYGGTTSSTTHATELADVDAAPASAGRRASRVSKLSQLQQQQQHFADAARDDGNTEDSLSARRTATVADRESDYHRAGRERRVGGLSPERQDPFAESASSSSSSSASSSSHAHASSYQDVMAHAKLEREEQAVLRRIERQRQDNVDHTASSSSSTSSSRDVDEEPAKKRSRWDVATPVSSSGGVGGGDDSGWETHKGGQQQQSRWDAPTPQGAVGAATPIGGSRWDAPTPSGDSGGVRKRSRWDETPVATSAADMATPLGAAAMHAQTPLQRANAAAAAAPATPQQLAQYRLHREMDARNRPQTDAELDELMPAEGYEILPPPASYVPIQTPSRLLLQTPTPMGAHGDDGLFHVPVEEAGREYDIPQTPGGEMLSRPDDVKHFGKLLEDVDTTTLTAEERTERTIMTLLLKIKNGAPPARRSAMRQITARACEFGPAALFNQLLPLLLSPALEDQERHVLVKVVDRVLYRLDDRVRPYVHKILVVIEPLLIDEDYYARVEGREIIANLAKAAGLASMIANMRPDIDNVDEYHRNTTARAFAVVASALGIHSLLPFLKAVCQSRRSWQARHTGVKIVQQVALLMGCAVLPHLRSLVEIISHGLADDQVRVKQITGQALSALAEAATPYGIESFESVLRPLWSGVREERGRTLAAYLQAIGFIIPLMEAEYANSFTRDVMSILVQQFESSDEHMKKTVLKVVKQCVSTDGVTAVYVREEIAPPLFTHFWTVRMALDKRNYRQLVATTVELAQKCGGADVVQRVVGHLKDENEQFRRMAIETIDAVLSSLGAADIDQRLEEVLIDGILYAFQEQQGEDERSVMLNGFGVVVNALGARCKLYLPQICGIIKWRLNNKTARVRQQAADLISRIAVVMSVAGEEALMAHLGVVLYEYLGEEYPEVLGSILGAIKSIVNVIGMENMTPPIKDLLPRLTPILRNRHEKVQENCIDLVGRIADRGAEYVSAKEWMRICFELLDMLKAAKKSIRRATVNTFGYIAKAIGPQDVLATLLNNLKVQERTNRVCTTVAIAIVAETCSPFTVLPALMNEYRVPELNVRNGVLKSLSFLFQYIGEMGRDYIYAVTTLLEDALTDRDNVHRQTACSVVQHMALGAFGLGREDALINLLNYVWPNIFETSPHLIQTVLDAIDALRLALGPTIILQYTLQGLFHPARAVRRVYWTVYNQMYLAAQDAMVPAYPLLEDDVDESARGSNACGSSTGADGGDGAVGGQLYSRPDLMLWL